MFVQNVALGIVKKWRSSMFQRNYTAEDVIYHLLKGTKVFYCCHVDYGRGIWIGEVIQHGV
jgi:hypothetical protein